MVERVRAAHGAGLDSLFVGDHHSTAPGSYYQNVVIMGRLLAEWDGPVVGALWLLPLWHPVVVAEHIGTLAALTPGRFVMQTAVGAGAAQFAPLGVDLGDRAGRFEAGLDIVRRLLAGESVTTGSEAPWRIEGARVAPRPAEAVEVWIGGTADRAVDRAARLGDGFLAAPELVPVEALDVAERYRARCAAHGRTPGPTAIRRDVHVGADDSDAARVVDPVLAAGYRGFRPDALVSGSPARVADELGKLAAMGYTDVIVRQLAPDQGDALASIERLAEVRRLVAGA